MKDLKSANCQESWFCSFWHVEVRFGLFFKVIWIILADLIWYFRHLWNSAENCKFCNLSGVVCLQKVSSKTQRSPGITRQLQSGHYSHWCKSRRNYCSQGVISQITGDKRISLSPDENRANYKGCFQLLFCEFFRRIGESWYAPIPHKTRVSRCVSYVLTPYNEHICSARDCAQKKISIGLFLAAGPVRL